jgi:hypothetical protein
MMAKAKRGRGVHTAVVLSPEVRDQLKESERGLSEEIRERIERTLEWDTHDEPTRELAADIMGIAHELNRQTGVAWHTNSVAHDALAAAVQLLLENTKPPAGSAAVSDLFVGDPRTRGRSVAQFYLRIKAENEKTRQELLRRHTGDKS